ncbi:MAG TPA: hypothetical protein VMF69_20205 [Gemmataceae bacterium]|nr:hypothetical protein [Gemmataceae bacterium]
MSSKRRFASPGVVSILFLSSGATGNSGTAVIRWQERSPQHRPCVCPCKNAAVTVYFIANNRRSQASSKRLIAAKREQDKTIAAEEAKKEETKLILHDRSVPTIVPANSIFCRESLLEGGPMRRCLGKACAGVLLLAVAGCMFDKFLIWQVVVYGPKVSVSGTVAEVSAKLMDGLSDSGLILNSKSVGSDHRIVGLWKSCVAFCLHLQQTKEKGACKTLVRMQWDNGGDQELWQLVLKILNAPSADDDSTSQQNETSSSP